MGRPEDIRQAIMDYASKGAKTKFYFQGYDDRREEDYS